MHVVPVAASAPSREQHDAPNVACRIDVTFKDEKDGSVKTVKVPIGTSLLEAAHENHIDLEGRISTVQEFEMVSHTHAFCG